MQRLRGFTLIELMVVVVIIAILAGVAYPNYVSHARKTKRGEAKARLLHIAQLEERYFTENNTYTTDIAPLLGFASGATIYSSDTNDSASGYQITAAAGGTGIAQSFTLSAVPQGGQTADTECGTLTLQHTGAKQITGTGALTRCWN